MKKSTPEIYLVKNKQFWHCQFISIKPITIQIRTGELKGNQELENTIGMQLNKFPTMERGVEDMSQLIQQKLEQGYHEIDGESIVRAAESKFLFQDTYNSTSKKELTQQKIFRKINLPEQTKSIVALTDDATNGKLVGEWPKFRMRTHLGETLDLGPAGESVPISCLLAQSWSENINPTNYLLSEKLDGMRIIWSGCEMFTRNGNSVNFPTCFVEGWPTTYLDGELWLDRGQFQKLVSIARKKQPDYKAWKDVKFMVFDAPMLEEPFANRYQKLKRTIEKIKNPHLVYVPHVLCKGYEHLKQELELAQQAGGEGLMLRDPQSMYEGKRSNTLLKVKTAMDAEATVIEHINGMGKFKDQLGALRVETDSGIQFQIGVGFNTKMRKQPPQIGSRVTYTYYGLTDDGKPRFPVFERVRGDF